MKMSQFYFLLGCMFYDVMDCLALDLGQRPDLIGLVQMVGERLDKSK